MSPRRPSIKSGASQPPSPKAPSPRTPRRFTRQRLERCDCGNPAVAIVEVRVGSDPQYIVRMPLCSACLKLEQDLKQDYE